MTKRNCNPWNAAKKLSVVRGNKDDEPEDLEPGVKFFVLMLEQLGCTTTYSCEGHPDGFYIMFYGPEDVARGFAVASGLSVELSSAGYRVSLDVMTWKTLAQQNKPFSVRVRNTWLKDAADGLVRVFGDLGTPTQHAVFEDPHSELARATQKLRIEALTLIDDDHEAGKDLDKWLGIMYALDEVELALACTPIKTP